MGIAAERSIMAGVPVPVPVAELQRFVAAMVDLYLVVTIATAVTAVVADRLVERSTTGHRIGDVTVREWQAYGFLAVVFGVALLLARLAVPFVSTRLGLSVVNRLGYTLILLWLLAVSRTDLLLVPEHGLVRFGVVVGFWAALHQPVLSNEGYLLLGGLLTFLAFYRETFTFLRGLVQRARQ